MENLEFQFGFEKLNVWQKAREFNQSIYKITETFPKEEKFNLSSQMRRASISISSNIAEGSAMMTPKHQNARYNDAYGSAIEVLNQTILASDLNYVDTQTLQITKENIKEIIYLINGLVKSNIQKISNQ